MQLPLITLAGRKTDAYARLDGGQRPTEGPRTVRVPRSRADRQVAFVRVQRALLRKASRGAVVARSRRVLATRVRFPVGLIFYCHIITRSRNNITNYKKKCCSRDSNPRPLRYASGTITTALRGTTGTTKTHYAFA